MRAFLIAGEASGDRLGAGLMAGIKSLAGKVDFDGIGGALMQDEGLASRFPMDELTLFGIAEVLPAYRRIKRRITETAKAVIDAEPDVLVTIDSPDFCLRVAKLVKAERSTRIVHYVAPSVWAWRSGRAAKMAASVDQVLALLPFEPPYLEAAGVRCDFVGHPAVAGTPATGKDVSAFRNAEGLGDAPILLVLPGSRRSEVKRLMPTFGEVLLPVLARNPSYRVVLPAALPIAQEVIDAAGNWPGTPVVLDPCSLSVDAADSRKAAAFAAADVALAASGTVSLELAASSTPMVVAYDMNWLTWQIVSRMFKVDTVTLVNLLLGENIVPEFLGPACKPASIADELSSLIADESKRSAQAAAMKSAMQMLGSDGDPPGLRAARAVLDGLESAS